MAQIPPIEIARHFPTTELALIGDELADGIELGRAGRPDPAVAVRRPAHRLFSLARLAHYTGTPPEHFQRFILFTNYHRYVDEFVDWAAAQLGHGRVCRAVRRWRALPDASRPRTRAGSSPTPPGGATRCPPTT